MNNHAEKCDFRHCKIPSWLKKAKDCSIEKEQIYGVGDDEVLEKINKHVQKGNLRERLFMKNGQKLIEALPNNQKFKLFEPKYNKQMKQLKNMGFNDEGKNM